MATTPEDEATLTTEQWARWALFGDPHNPRVIPGPLRELFSRLVRALLESRAEVREPKPAGR